LGSEYGWGNPCAIVEPWSNKLLLSSEKNPLGKGNPKKKLLLGARSMCVKERGKEGGIRVWRKQFIFGPFEVQSTVGRRIR
jgi:hypothetical protein